MLKLTETQIIISAQADRSSPILAELLDRIVSTGCNVIQSSVQNMGTDMAINMLVDGKWSAIAKLETQIPSLESKIPCRLLVARTHAEQNPEPVLRYMVQILGFDAPGQLQMIHEFLSVNQINIDEMNTYCFLNSDQQSMASITLKISIPSPSPIGEFKDMFISFCEDNQLEISLELSPF